MTPQIPSWNRLFCSWTNCSTVVIPEWDIICLNRESSFCIRPSGVSTSTTWQQRTEISLSGNPQSSPPGNRRQTSAHLATLNLHHLATEEKHQLIWQPSVSTTRQQRTNISSSGYHLHPPLGSRRQTSAHLATLNLHHLATEGKHQLIWQPSISTTWQQRTNINSSGNPESPPPGNRGQTSAHLATLNLYHLGTEDKHQLIWQPSISTTW